MKKILYIMMFTVISFLSMSWMTPSSSDNSMYGAEKEIKESEVKALRKLDNFYSLDNENAYYYGRVIEVADVNTFETISYGYAKDSKNAYYMGEIIERVDASTFKVLSYGCAKDSKNVYYRGKIIEKADPKTFKERNYYYSLDNKNVYYMGEIIKGAAPKTFKEIDYYYSLDNKNVYFYGKMVEGLDAKTFKVLGDLYSKDSKSVYYNGKIIKEADAKSFLIIPNNVSGFYGLDYNYVYVKDKTSDEINVIYPSMNYSNVYVKDDYRVYLDGEVLEGADSLSFQKIGSDIARDKFCIYWYNKKLKNIDVETFEYIGEECPVKNRDMVREYCSCCSKVSIFKDKNGEYRTDDKDFVEKFVVK